MLFDKQNLFSDQQNLAQAAGTYTSTNAIDLGANPAAPLVNSAGGTFTPIKDLGRGGQAELVAQVTETFTSGGAATVTAQLIQSAASNLGSPTVLASSQAIAVASLVAGYQFRIEVPVGVSQRYLGMQYVIGTAATTAGKVTAGFTTDRQTNPTV